jgi:hypothetical protein
MMVMGVSFAVFMRTERMAAGNFRNDVVTRQLLEVALNQALMAIDASMVTNVYPPFEVANSPGTASISGATNAPAMSWIPASVVSASSVPVDPKWIDISGKDARVGYVVFNCSGLLDVNHVGGAARGIGTNVNEIQIADLPEIGSSAGATSLIAGRPYETGQELSVLGTSAGGGLSGMPSNLVTYSYGVSTGTVVDISGDLTVPGRGPAIVAGLISSGIPATQAPFVFTNLLDYVDTDSIPRDLGSPCTEAVPMLNEVQVYNMLQFRPGQIRSRVIVNIEWYYPFVRVNPASLFDIRCDIQVDGGSTKSAYVPASTNMVIASHYDRTPSMTNRCYAEQFSAVTGWGSYTTGDTVQISVKVGAQVLLGGTATPVDSTPWPFVTSGYFTTNFATITIPSAPPASIANLPIGWECADPRFNWSTSASPPPRQWRPYLPTSSGTLNATNTWTADYLATYRANAEQSLEMYVSDFGSLRSVAELSYLLRGSGPTYKWSTIKICDDQRAIALDRILDNFSIGTNVVLQGQFNPNSRNIDAWAAVLRDMPVDAYPGEPAVAPLSKPDAYNLATALVGSSGKYTNLSDFGRATNVFSVSPLAGLSFLRQESIMRNTYGLLQPRQNYFMILLFAQSSKIVPGLTDISALPSMRAIAEVWQDPSSVAPRKTKVRLLRIIDTD